VVQSSKAEPYFLGFPSLPDLPLGGRFLSYVTSCLDRLLQLRNMCRISGHHGLQVLPEPNILRHLGLNLEALKAFPALGCGLQLAQPEEAWLGRKSWAYHFALSCSLGSGCPRLAAYTPLYLTWILGFTGSLYLGGCCRKTAY
jgi:hypothetical protein